MPDGRAFTIQELAQEKQPGEHYMTRFFRGVFGAIDICMTESGCPLTDEQRAILRECIPKGGPT